MPSSAVVQSTFERRTPPFRRRLPIGAEPIDAGRTHVRVWAPRATRVEVVLVSGTTTALDRESHGYFSGLVNARAGDRYRFRLDGRDRLFPDPASRYQPEGPHGPSEIIDPCTFRWTDDGWRGVVLDEQVFYELHVGTFTRPGTWAAAGGELAELARLGITCIEVMPVAEFEGRFGWGYDGVDAFAPSHLYGTPDDFRRFVDAAHAVGLGVILDVVHESFRSGRQLSAGVFARPTSPTSTTTSGARPSISMVPTPRRFVNSSSRTPDTGSRNSISTACASMRRSRSSTSPTSTFLRRWDGARAPRPASAPSSSWRKTSRRRRGSFVRCPRAGTGSTRCGTTTSITARWWR